MMKPRLRHFASHDLRRFAIFLRYGSLTNSDTIQRSTREILALTGIKIPAQLNLYRKFVRDGNIYVKERIGPAPGALRMLTPEQEQWVTAR